MRRFLHLWPVILVWLIPIAITWFNPNDAKLDAFGFALLLVANIAAVVIAIATPSVVERRRCDLLVRAQVARFTAALVTVSGALRELSVVAKESADAFSRFASVLPSSDGTLREG